MLLFRFRYDLLNEEIQTLPSSKEKKILMETLLSKFKLYEDSVYDDTWFYAECEKIEKDYFDVKFPKEEEKVSKIESETVIEKSTSSSSVAVKKPKQQQGEKPKQQKGEKPKQQKGGKPKQQQGGKPSPSGAKRAKRRRSKSKRENAREAQKSRC